MNKTLHRQKKDKHDEYYTLYETIENELAYYDVKYFKNKIVYCNCDNPYESNFFKYFVINFNRLGLKKLICSCYNGQPGIGEQMTLFDDSFSLNEKALKIEINVVDDSCIKNPTVENVLRLKDNRLIELKGNGSFDSPECIETLKESDIVVSNPPFSLFRRYIYIINKYKKDFIVLGTLAAISYKDIYTMFMCNKIYVGATINGDSINFLCNNKLKNVNVVWYTTIKSSVNKPRLQSIMLYEPKNYFKYNNYDAIHIDKIKYIPYNYKGVMGVPITFICKYDWSKDYEIIKFRRGDDNKDLNYTDGKGNKICPYIRILIKHK